MGGGSNDDVLELIDGRVGYWMVSGAALPEGNGGTTLFNIMNMGRDCNSLYRSKVE